MNHKFIINYDQYFIVEFKLIYVIFKSFKTNYKTLIKKLFKLILIL